MKTVDLWINPGDSESVSWMKSMYGFLSCAHEQIKRDGSKEPHQTDEDIGHLDIHNEFITLPCKDREKYLQMLEDDIRKG